MVSKQVYIPPLKEINHPHYNETKPNEQHHYNLFYIPHNAFEGNKYNYMLRGVDVASKYKVARVLESKKASKVTFVLEAIYKRGCGFKSPKVFQFDNGPEFKSDVTRLLEIHDVDIR